LSLSQALYPLPRFHLGVFRPGIHCQCHLYLVRLRQRRPKRRFQAGHYQPHLAGPYRRRWHTSNQHLFRCAQQFAGYAQRKVEFFLQYVDESGFWRLDRQTV